MRHSILGLVILTLVIIPARMAAYSHPTDPTATFMGSFPVEAIIGNVHSYNVILVWGLTNGGIDYVYDIEGVTFSSESCSDVNSLTLDEIVEASADAAIAEGVSRGYPLCLSTPFSKNVRIWTAACAERVGSGCSTAFEACSTDTWSYRTYEVYCPGGGNPVITQKTGLPGNCSGSCEASYPDSYLE